uniref:GH16 domain-containing protein n=1 Tax=viral metagenome TaxID=1070528 RepID=A0A6C0JQF4_9ZZZZ
MMVILFLLLLFIALSIVYYTFFYQKGYRKIIDVHNVKSLRKHFLLDNPNLDGSDPTDGMVNYAFMFKRDANGKIIPNVNGDASWQEIPESPSLISDYDGGIMIKLDDKLDANGNVGAPRLISRKLFRGGLFVFDVEHTPIGCGVWPALWLNGFVGGPDQYHEKKGTHKYNEGMKKIVKYTVNEHKENYNRLCKPGTNLTPAKDKHLSEWLGKDTYVAMWPTGGEFDILEQTNFSDTNLVSIHGGPLCEVVNGYKNEYMVKEPGKDYVNAGVRSVCGVTFWHGGKDPKDPATYGLGPYSGCKDKTHQIGEQGGARTTLPDGNSRFNCPNNSATNAGNSQINAPPGSFGPQFNAHGGGVYAVQWTPKDIVNVWWWPRKLWSRKYLRVGTGPLSDFPDPDTWPGEDYPSKDNVSGEMSLQKILVASYVLDGKNALTDGCDFNFQGITINITLGGGWGGGAMPKYCSVDYKSEWKDYITKCYKADPGRAATQGHGVDPVTKCYDGGMTEADRGINAPAVFYSEAYFKIRSIRIFQKNKDDNIW